jgi:hypothetical protein
MLPLAVCVSAASSRLVVSLVTLMVLMIMSFLVCWSGVSVLLLSELAFVGAGSWVSSGGVLSRRSADSSDWFLDLLAVGRCPSLGEWVVLWRLASSLLPGAVVGTVSVSQLVPLLPLPSEPPLVSRLLPLLVTLLALSLVSLLVPPLALSFVPLALWLVPPFWSCW